LTGSRGPMVRPRPENSAAIYGRDPGDHPQRGAPYYPLLSIRRRGVGRPRPGHLLRRCLLPSPPRWPPPTPRFSRNSPVGPPGETPIQSSGRGTGPSTFPRCAFPPPASDACLAPLRRQPASASSGAPLTNGARGRSRRPPARFAEQTTAAARGNACHANDRRRSSRRPWSLRRTGGTSLRRPAERPASGRRTHPVKSDDPLVGPSNLATDDLDPGIEARVEANGRPGSRGRCASRAWGRRRFSSNGTEGAFFVLRRSFATPA